jgi:hypothetical protein
VGVWLNLAHTFQGVLRTLTHFEAEWHRDDCDNDCTDFTRYLGCDRSCTSACSSAHPGSYEDHIGSGKGGSDLTAAFHRR